MRVYFAGSPPFATAILEKLLKSNHVVVGLLTPPDKPKGRGQQVEISPLAKLAAEQGVGVLYTSNANDPETISKIRAASPDVLVVASFGQLLKDELLNLAPQGALNVHASLLPHLRGASPIACAIQQGDRETGVAIQRMVRKLDAGPVAAMATLTIGEHDTTGDLTERLSVLGAETLLKTLDAIEHNTVHFEPQDESRATHARKLKKEDGVISWARPAVEIDRLVRSMTPWPGAQTTLTAAGTTAGNGVRLRILEVRLKVGVATAEIPGSILALPSDPQGRQPDTLDVATSSGVLTILRLQPEGGKALAAPEFLRGRRLTAGAKLL